MGIPGRSDFFQFIDQCRSNPLAPMPVAYGKVVDIDFAALLLEFLQLRRITEDTRFSSPTEFGAITAIGAMTPKQKLALAA